MTAETSTCLATCAAANRSSLRTNRTIRTSPRMYNMNGLEGPTKGKRVNFPEGTMIVSTKPYILRIAVGFFIICAFLISPGSSTAQKQHRRGHHHDLKQFEKFLEQHPSIATDLSKDPALTS